MKQIYLVLCIGLFIGLVGCDGIDRQLELPDNLNLMLMETARVRNVLPGDTVVVEVLAGTNNSLKQMEIHNKSQEFEILSDSISFAMIEEPLALDKNGNFSRPVSTVLIKIPLVVPADAGKIQLVTDITLTTDKGKKQTVRAVLKVTNFKAWDKVAEIDNSNGFPMASMFYSTKDHQVYSRDNYARAKKGIDIFQYLPSGNKKIYFQSPGSEATGDYFTKLPFIIPGGYKRGEMNNTLFIAMPGVDYATVDEDTFDMLDFLAATDQIEVRKNDVIGFLTQDGRKGVILVKDVQNLGYTIVTSVLTKMQLRGVK